MTAEQEFWVYRLEGSDLVIVNLQDYDPHLRPLDAIFAVFCLNPRT